MNIKTSLHMEVYAHARKLIYNSKGVKKRIMKETR